MKTDVKDERTDRQRERRRRRSTGGRRRKRRNGKGGCKRLSRPIYYLMSYPIGRAAAVEGPPAAGPEGSLHPSVSREEVCECDDQTA